MSKLAWYWHRFRAMEPIEVALHARKKVRQFFDARGISNWKRGKPQATGTFPQLPSPQNAPQILRDGLRRDVDEILGGRWKAFGHLELRVDDPPRWHRDYLIGKEFATDESAFRLNHRELPDGADIKLIWELSRWHQLTRLAMAAYVLQDERAAIKCLDWLDDWVRHNPPYRGWNWTSALEVGMRLIQFTWIHALLDGLPNRSSALRQRLEALSVAVLPAHARYAWRHRSFGSSANNHLIGELAGLIVASARWPHLIDWWVSLEELQQLWEREVLAQFAEDGGNKEQALNYHLFSWEFCWQARMALHAAGREPQAQVEERLRLAAEFFGCIEVERDSWSYGDSDDGSVTPFCARTESSALEWWNWLRGQMTGESILYWIGVAPKWTQRGKTLLQERGGMLFEDSGIAIDDWNLWRIRFDLSPLGYLSTAAHGHLDALHLTIWHRGVAMVIDPGTGAYFAEPSVRRFLASWEAHNGPHPVHEKSPSRTGPFLWAAPHHPVPRPKLLPSGIRAELDLSTGKVVRELDRVAADGRWEVADSFFPAHEIEDRVFTVRWQFAPGMWVKRLGERAFSVHREQVALEIRVDDQWAEVDLVEKSGSVGPAELTDGQSLEGLVSPAFRKLCWAPYLKLTARPEAGNPCLFRTTFLASPAK